MGLACCVSGFMSSLAGTQRLLRRRAERVSARSPSLGVAQPPCPAPRKLQGSQVPAPPGQACPDQSHSQVIAALWPQPSAQFCCERWSWLGPRESSRFQSFRFCPCSTFSRNGGGAGGGLTLQDPGPEKWRLQGGPESPHRGPHHAWTGSPMRRAPAGFVCLGDWGRCLSCGVKWS